MNSNWSINQWFIFVSNCIYISIKLFLYIFSRSIALLKTICIPFHKMFFWVISISTSCQWFLLLSLKKLFDANEFFDYQLNWRIMSLITNFHWNHCFPISFQCLFKITYNFGWNDLSFLLLSLNKNQFMPINYFTPDDWFEVQSFITDYS